MMLNDPLYRVIPRMAIPTIVSMLITSFYNLADTYFVSSLGTSATAAVGINFSLDNLIMTAGAFLGVGANSYIARLLGAKRDKYASQVLSTAVFSALITGSAAMIAGLVFLDPLVRALGATPDVVPFAKDYASYVLLAAPFMATNFVMNHCLRSEGSAVYAMVGMVAGAVLNIGLDPLFIFTFGWGIRGAAAATALSKLVSFLILLVPYVRRSSLLHLSPRNILYSRDIVFEVVKMGFPSLMRTGLMSVSTIILNNIAALFSSSVLAAMSVVSRVMMFLFAAVLGFGQGFQPVAGFNWGARRYDRVLKGFRFASLAGVAGISFLSLIMGVFARDIMLLFSKNDEVLIAVGVLSIQLQCLVMPIHGWVVIVNMCYAGLGQARGAAILSITRQGLFYIPMLFLLPRLFGAEGLAAAQAAADLLSLAVALPLAVRIIRHIRQRQLDEPFGGALDGSPNGGTLSGQSGEQPAELPADLPSA